MDFEQLANLPIHKILRSLILVFFSNILPYQFENDSPVLPTYDFIVVGAGAAGSVVASRLAETSASVLLLEEGPSATPESSVPFFYLFLQSSEIVKKTKLAVQENTQFELQNETENYLEGSAMGGGTSVNGFQFYKGSREDFDRWSDLGNVGWDYDSVLPFYKKSEDYKGSVLPGSENLYGKGGPVTVTPRIHNDDFQSIFQQSGRELGYSPVDPSGPLKIGFANVHSSIKNGVRVSTSEVYLKPIVKKKNILIKPGASVRKILFNRSKRAVGVEFMYRGKRRRVGVDKEIILCAGAFNSPKLLMLSGVGPEDHLRELGIDVVADVDGVGKNLQDHHFIGDVTFSLTGNLATTTIKDFLSILKKFPTYKTTPKGYLTEFGPSGGAYVNVNDKSNSNWPDVSVPFVVLPGVLIASVILTHPESRGSVRLRSKNYEDEPEVDFRYLEESRDLETLVKGLKFAKKVSETKAMQKHLKLKFISKTPSSCKSFRRFSDDYWECYARNKIRTYYHASGTCKMAPETDPKGVVSPRLKVRGVEGVRIADASIMPRIVSVNLMSTVIMIGEKTADLIKQDWNL